MTFPPPSAPAGAGSGDQTPKNKPQSAGLIVLAVAMAVLLAGVGLVWYINEQDSDDDAPSGQPNVVWVSPLHDVEATA